jgi:hypothetical protein
MLLNTTFPLCLMAYLLRIQKPMAVRMKGKEMTNHQHSKENSRHSHSLTALSSMAMEATIRSLMAMTTLTASIAISDSLEGLWSATCTAQPSQGKFADTGCKASQDALLSPDGNFGAKSPYILEGLFEKSFCSTKQVSLLPVLLKVSRTTRRLADHVLLSNHFIFIPFH